MQKEAQLGGWMTAATFSYTVGYVAVFFIGRKKSPVAHVDSRDSLAHGALAVLLAGVDLDVHPPVAARALDQAELLAAVGADGTLDNQSRLDHWTAAAIHTTTAAEHWIVNYRSLESYSANTLPGRH